MEISCSFTEESTFGPVVLECRRDFDFTLLFEEIFFVLLPSCLFLIVTATRFFVICNEPFQVRRSALYTLKLVSQNLSQL